MLLQEMEEKNKINEEVASLLADAVLKFDFLGIKMSKNVHVDVTKSECGTSGS